MKLTSIILLSILGISCLLAAPVPKKDYKAEARKFFGSIMTAVSSGDKEKMVELLTSKFMYFISGTLSDEQTAAFQKAIVAKKEGRDYTPAPAMLAEIKQGMMTKVEALTPESKAFFKSTGDALPDQAPKLREIAPLVRSVADKYAALSPAARDNIEANFPAMSRLQELADYVEVADALIGHVIGMCGELDGFDECSAVLALVQ